jgi:hypothetical protein
MQDEELYLKMGGWCHHHIHGATFSSRKVENALTQVFRMVPITNKINSDQQAYLTMSKNGPTVTNVSVNQQVNDRIIMHCGGGSHFMANTIQTNSSSELDNYHHQPLGSSTT